MNSEAVILTLLSILLFGSHFGLRELLGIILVILGTSILVWNEK
jgi:drug/metabolite transporter (DMT)-like permease